jgi:Ethanolamine utilization protein EutJ (predicted chaperonin)
MHRTLIAVLVAATAAIALTACGDSGKTVTVVERTVVTGDESQASASAPTPVSDTDSAGVEVPDLVGERLDVAEDDLQEQDLDYKEIGGGTFGIVVLSNWEVCETKPSAGDDVGQGDEVKLIVERVGSC